MNFLEISSEIFHPLVQFNKGQKQLLEQLIELDSQFLKNQKIMDYSLLLVIESNNDEMMELIIDDQ